MPVQKSIVILGLGLTGGAVAKYCAERLGTTVSSVTVIGGAASKPGKLSCELENLGCTVKLGTEQIEGHFDLAVVSPGISEFSGFFAEAEAHADEVIGEPEFAYRQSPEHWVAITGTNGKTTTTSLSTALLHAAGMKAEAVGNIGTIITGRLDERPADSWFVAELSSFQLATTKKLHPHVAVLLNITPDHLEWHKTLENYAAAKEKIFQNLTKDDLAIISVDDDYSRAICERVAARGIRVCELTVQTEPDIPYAAFLRGSELIVRRAGEEQHICTQDELSIRGLHNVENALAASALALELHVGLDAIRSGLSTFKPLEHRIEPCGEVNGVHFVNDSKATNTDSVQKALTAFKPGHIILLLGGHDKETPLTDLACDVAKDVRVAVCYGAAGPRIAEALQNEHSDTLTVVEKPHMHEAFDKAVAVAKSGDTVLLSPACSSFDEFHNMAERGRAFKSYVADLIAKTRE
ncbi:MAG: UDP-N-acetylmuramoyl-L-alanine--D-glutamate ligase [Coriobacteriaceae bacterium]